MVVRQQPKNARSNLTFGLCPDSIRSFHTSSFLKNLAVFLSTHRGNMWTIGHNWGYIVHRGSLTQRGICHADMMCSFREMKVRKSILTICWNGSSCMSTASCLHQAVGLVHVKAMAVLRSKRRHVVWCNHFISCYSKQITVHSGPQKTWHFLFEYNFG